MFPGPTTGQVQQDQQWNADKIYDQQSQARAVNAAQNKLASMRKPSVSLDGRIRSGGRGDPGINIPWWKRR